MFLDRLLKTEQGNISYTELKMVAQDGVDDGTLPYSYQWSTVPQL